MFLLDRYIMRQFLTGLVPVLLLLLVLFGFMALAEELEDVGKGAYTTFDALRVVFYTSARHAVDLMPVAMLLGGLLGLGAMASHNELIVIRAMGLSRRRIALPVLILGLSMAFAVAAAQSLLVPKAEREASAVRALALTDTNVAGAEHLEFWTRSGDDLLRVNEVRHGHLLTDLEVYSVDSAGRLEQLVEAQYATLVDAVNWRLEGVTVTRLQTGNVSETRHETLLWPSLLSPKQADILVQPLESLAPWDLMRLVAILRANGLNDHQHRVALWRQLSIPITLVAMSLLALPLLLGQVRTISAGTRILIGGGIGMGFYLLQELAGHLAGLFTLSPPLMIMTPAVLLLAVSVYVQFLHVRR